MANTNRRFKDKNGLMFMPMNIDGGYFSDTNFINSAKIAVIAILLFGGGIACVCIYGWMVSITVRLIAYILLFTIIQFIVRYYILEENYFYRMYNLMKKHRITDSDIFWNIASIKDTQEGAIAIYSDMRVGIIVKIERDTIVGRNKDFKETHFDSISEFYKALNNKGLKFVQMNIMEQAGNDPRIAKLEELIIKPENKNISMLMEMQIGYIKSIARKTLYESDYFLIYSEQASKADTIIDDSIDCVYYLLDGAYIGYRVLTLREILELQKNLYGVKYFDHSKATLKVYNSINVPFNKPFIYKEILFKGGENRVLSQADINKISNIASGIINRDIQYSRLSVKQALDGKGIKENKVDTMEAAVNTDKTRIEDGDKVSEPNSFVDVILGEKVIDDSQYIDF